MKRFILIFAIVAMIVPFFVFPASAAFEDTNITVVDYLDYVDRDHMIVDGDQKYVIIDIPSDKGESVFIHDGDNRYAYGSYDDVYLNSSANPFRFASYPMMQYQILNGRFSTGYLFDVSSLPDGACVVFDWQISLEGLDGNIGYAGEYPDFYYTCFFFNEASDGSAYAYQTGRSHISSLSGTWNKGKLDCIAIYEHGYGTVGTATDYISPWVAYNDLLSTYLPNSFSIRVSSVRVEIPIDDNLISLAQNEKTQKLLDEVNRQLEDQGKTMDQVLKEQQQTNDKLDGVQDSLDDTNDKLDDVHGAIDDTNDKLDNITDHDPTPERPDWQDSVDDLEDVEQGALDNVQTGMDDADKTFSSALGTLKQYAASFAGLTILFNSFADMPFFTALLSISLSLGIVAAILGIGLDAVRSSNRANARSSKKGRSG